MEQVNALQPAAVCHLRHQAGRTIIFLSAVDIPSVIHAQVIGVKVSRDLSPAVGIMDDETSTLAEISSAVFPLQKLDTTRHLRRAVEKVARRGQVAAIHNYPLLPIKSARHDIILKAML